MHLRVVKGYIFFNRHKLDKSEALVSDELSVARVRRDDKLLQRFRHPTSMVIELAEQFAGVMDSRLALKLGIADIRPDDLKEGHRRQLNLLGEQRQQDSLGRPVEALDRRPGNRGSQSYNLVQ